MRRRPVAGSRGPVDPTFVRVAGRCDGSARISGFRRSSASQACSWLALGVFVLGGCGGMRSTSTKAESGSFSETQSSLGEWCDAFEKASLAFARAESAEIAPTEFEEALSALLAVEAPAGVDEALPILAQGYPSVADYTDGDDYAAAIEEYALRTTEVEALVREACEFDGPSMLSATSD